MKRNKKSKWLITAMIISLYMLTGCGKSEQQSEQQNATDIVTFQMVPSSNGVEDYIEQVFGDDYDEETAGRYYNVVPEDISNDYGISIFKSDLIGYGALIYDSEIYQIGGWGGDGVTSFAIADLNEDGEFELYFTYTCGSGMIRSEVGYFDTATKEIVTFDYSSIYSDYDTEITEEMRVKPFSIWFANILLEVDTNNVLCVYDVDPESYNWKSYVDIEMSAGEKLASIVADNGEISLAIESD
ncbi:MAG: hypothetical protein K2K21_15295 [Lachnospiraceae bacterium]|nr:hypothetical protein [Lachnospiraceae bacterium]